jgi:flagellar M-ring protein FliF
VPEFISKLQRQILEFWTNLEKSQKIRIGVTSGVIAIAIIVGIFLITRPNYTTIISNSDPKDVADMKTVLDGKKITSKLIDNNTGIMVNLKDSDNAHFELTKAGYPKNGTTFADALGSIKINTTESDKKQIWKNLDESDIKRLLLLNGAIKDADVKVTQPDVSMFSDAAKPSAVVALTPKNEALTQEQVKGIVDLVAKSIAGLSSKDVTVIDNNTGNSLNSGESDDALVQADTQYKQKKTVEIDLEGNVNKLLNNARSDSYDRAIVVVNPVLDFDKQTQQQKTLENPVGMTGGALDSSRIIKEDLTNGATNGVPGITSNPTTSTPSYPTGSSGTGNYKKSDATENYSYNETQSATEKGLGEMIPEKSTSTVTLLYGDRVIDSSKLTPQYLQDIKNMVSTATRIPAASITVTTMKIAPVVLPKKTLNDTIKELINTYGIPAVLLILVGLMMISMIPKKKQVALEPQLATAGGPDLAAGQAGPRFIVPETEYEDIPEIGLEERSEVKKQIDKFVKQKPDAVANLLRNWLSDEWD